MTFPPSDKTFQGVMTDQQTRLTLVERRLATIGRGSVPTLAPGMGGGSTVVIDGYTYPVSWAVPYDPSGSPDVYLLPDGQGGYIAMGQRDPFVYVPLVAPAGPHSLWAVSSAPFEPDSYSYLRVAKASTGIVTGHGVITRTATSSGWTAGQVVMTLPEGYRPDFDSVFLSAGSTGAIPITVYPDGRVAVRVATTASWIGVQFAYPAAGVAAWTQITVFENGFGDYTLSNSGNDAFGRTGYWVDPFGLIWMTGLARVGTAPTADNTAMFSIPELDVIGRTNMNQHWAIAANATFGMLGCSSAAGNKVLWKTGSPTAVNSWLALCGAHPTPGPYLLGTGQTSSTWMRFEPNSYMNSWGAHSAVGGSNARPLLVRRPDGLATSHGLLASGTLPSSAITLPEQIRPKNRLMMTTASSNALGRHDLYYREDIQDIAVAPTRLPSSLVPVTGSNSWFAIDNQVWTPN